MRSGWFGQLWKHHKSSAFKSIRTKWVWVNDSGGSYLSYIIIFHAKPLVKTTGELQNIYKYFNELQLYFGNTVKF